LVAAAVQERKAARELVLQYDVKSVVKSVVEPLGVVTPSTSIESLGAAALGASLPVQVCDKVDTQTPRAANDAQMLAPSMPSLSRYKPRWADCFENENENDKDDVWKTVPVEIAPFELPRPPDPHEVALLRSLPEELVPDSWKTAPLEIAPFELPRPPASSKNRKLFRPPKPKYSEELRQIFYSL
jgi:hypothetical protein